MSQILAYLKFLFGSTNQHGVHSPFIFKFVTQCLYDSTNYQAYKDIKNYRDKLLKTKKTLEVTDFGAGSKIFSSNFRTVSGIAKTSGTSTKKAKLLFKIAKYFKPKSSLELGTSLGIGTFAISKGYSDNEIISIEGCHNISNEAKQHLSLFNAHNIRLKIGSFKKIIPELKGQFFDFIFLDGNHTKEATINNFERILAMVSATSILILDDIYWSQEMTEAWSYIKDHQSVNVTVDCFHFGIVFFRTEQAKEHFKIRV